MQNGKIIAYDPTKLRSGDKVAVVARVSAYRMDENERIKVGHGLKLVEVYYLDKEPDSDK